MSPRNEKGVKRIEASHPVLQPLKHHQGLELIPSGTTGPVSFFNPTRARFHPKEFTKPPTKPHSEPIGAEPCGSKPKPTITYKWTSRNNRKGRHALAVYSNVLHSEAPYTLPPLTASVIETCRGIWRMMIVYPVWDVSYNVATIFTLGSVVWVINAFFVWFPLVRPDTEFENEELYGGGITAFIGATIFEIGSILLMLEAVNENRTGCFGWALERALSQDTVETGLDTLCIRPSKSDCTHHHPNKTNIVGKGWIWFPPWNDLRAHYLHEIGFLASCTQLLAATTFWISGFTALPGIYNHMSRVIAIIFYWTPQVIGGTGFIISGALFMIETQPCWYKPAFGTLGWWIGAWNLIGGVGFTLCPAFGYDESSWAQYQACVSTFWGSWAFLVGSVIQWYESLVKYPVEEDKRVKPGGKG